MRFIVVLLFLGLAHAQAPQIDRAMSISYGSTSWNADSKKIDSAYLIMRDKASGKTAQIQLEETEPDSSQFRGQFSVSWADQKVTPEIYIPPQELRNSDKDIRKLYSMIQSGQLQRKPVIWKKNERGQAMMDVYDTREQAEAAMKAYQEEQRLAQEAKAKKLLKPIPSQANLAVAKQAEKQAMLDKLAMEAAKRESERVRLEQIERQKALERERQAKAATEAERQRRKAEAAALVEQAMVHYNDGDYKNAEAKFEKAVDLDPENKSYYFKYGVVLYRNSKFNEALVILKIANDPASDLEKRYYIGLIHYRLSELDAAAEMFKGVGAAADPVLSPSSLFYLGVVQFAQEKFELAKKNFETVIDTSQDPRLDDQAEDYLDRIANAMVYKKMRENKWTVMGIVGMMYDSNVLLAPDSNPDQGGSLDIQDFRLLTIGDVEYRPVFSEHHEWSTKLNAALTNSVKDESARADPYQFNLSSPYSYKGMLWNKGYRFTARPAVEQLFMAADGSDTKSLILSSYILALENTFMMKQTHFATYILEYRMDDSRLASSIGDNDLDANKISVRTVQSFFLDKNVRQEALVANLGYVRNIAKGKNRTFDRYEVGATYVRPVKWKASWNLGLNLFQLDFGDADPNRTDFNVTVTSGISKPIKDWVTWGVTGSYTKNDSTQTALFEYNKWMVMTTATFQTNF